jgi:hypothetical protein
VDGGSTSSNTVRSGQPASYNLTLTPLNNYAGTVVLNCTPITPADFATCSFSSSIIPLNGSPQSAIATLQTVTSVKLASNIPPRRPGGSHERLGSALLSLLTPALFFFWRRPYRFRSRLSTLWSTALTAATLATLLATNGCGSGGDASLRYSTPGTYQYQITASSTSGIQITQAVTLNLTIQPR